MRAGGPQRSAPRARPRGTAGAIALVVAATAACSSAVLGPVETPGEGPWSSVPLTPEWTDIARQVAGDHSRECEAVYQALESEQRCSASLCEHAASLAKEWMLRCEDVSRGRTTAVASLSATFDERASQPATECGRRATAILRDECSDEGACRPLVQRWGASCAATEATPLVVRKLERAVSRAEGKEGFSLDGRSCSDLFAEVIRASHCESKRQCEGALGAVDAYRGRCLVPGEPVSWATAISLIGVLSGAGRKVASLPISREDAQRGPDGPLAMGEERGALLRVCGEPVTGGKQVVQARRDCKGGDFTWAKAFDEPGGAVVRVGALRFDDDRSFRMRFPTLHVAAEEIARAELALPELEQQLDQAAQQVRAGATYEAWRTLAKALVAHAEVLEHPRVAASLVKRDEALAPALRELGKAKVLAARRAPVNVDLAAFAQRASSRVLGDLREEGIVEIGAPEASHADLVESMPRSVAAYRDAVSEIAAVLKQRNVREVDPAAAERAAQAELTRCGAAVKEARAAEDELIRCAFGIDACEPDKIAARTQELDRAREALRLAVERVDALVAGPAQRSAAAIGAAQRAAGCVRE